MISARVLSQIPLFEHKAGWILWDKPVEKA